MTRIFLTLQRPAQHSQVDAICAIHGDHLGLATGRRTFRTVSELEAALDNAGMNSYPRDFAMNSIRSGYPTFLEISEHEGLALGVLVLAATADPNGSA